MEYVQTNIKEFDLCFMDIQMPVMDGLTATREIRKIKVKQKNRNKELPIIALTAGVLEDEKQLCYDAGMNSFLRKPIKIEILKEIIKKNL